jgi:two-component system sensor histidine kinase KdpD
MDQRTRLVARIVASLATVGLVTTVYYRFVPVNPTTVALTYVVVVLLMATRWGIAEATIASVVAVACFNFFFLPPFLTWTIADSQNWVAFIVFMLTAVIVSQLSGRSRQRQIEALARQRDLERLYALSRALLLSEPTSSVPSAIADRIADAFELPSVALYDRHTDTIVFGGATDLPGIEAKLRDVFRQAVSLREPSGTMITAIRLGGAPIGSLALKGADLSDTVLQSIVNLAAIALERARGQEAAARAEAARQSADLRATVLDAVAHEFKTPLTSMKAASSDLRTSQSIGDRDRELAGILDEEVDRFQTLVTDAVHMLRIDAGDFVVHVGRHNLANLVDATLRRFERQLDGHDLVKRVPVHLTVDADRELLALALRQLLDNALKYSPAASTIEIQARTNGTLDIVVRNSGSMIPDLEQMRVVERFYRGACARNIPGTGMGLTIVQQIAQAHGGTLTLSSASDSGTAFMLSLPRGESNQ